MGQTFGRFKVVWLRLMDISPHPKIQRTFNKAWGDTIAREFDPDKFLPLLVCPARREGKYYCFGGQHRRYGAEQALGKEQRVPCHVYEGYSLDRLADVSLGQDRIRGWKAIERWWKRVIAKEAIPVAVEAILARHDLKTSKTRGPNVIQAVTALESVFKGHGGEPTVDRVIAILKSAYGSDRDAFDGALIQGAGVIVHQFDGQVDDQEFAHKLSRHCGPARLIGQARDYMKTNGVTARRAMAERMLKIYNAGRRRGRLAL